MMLVLVAEGGGRMVEEAEKRWGMADGAERRRKDFKFM
jgi:hypothetical protein